MSEKDLKKITLCIVNPHGYALYNKESKCPFGGAEVQLFLLSKEFAKNKSLEVNVITGDINFHKSEIKKFHNLIIHIVEPLDKKLFNSLKRHLNLFYTLIKINPDLIIQRVAGIETATCAIYSKLYRKSFIYSTAHENEVIKGGQKGLVRIAYNIGLKFANVIVCQTRDQKNKLSNWKGGHRNNIVILKNVYKIKDIEAVQKKYILWVGKALKWKRGELFITVAERFPKFNFIMICMKTGNLKYWNYLYMKAQKLNNLTFIGFVPFQKIDKYFIESKLFISTSIYEGFPNTFLQALYNKTPVISLNVDPDKILTTYKCGFNCEDNFDRLVETVKIFYQNENLFKEYSLNAFKYVNRNHNIYQIADKWIKLIFNLIK